MTAGDRSHVTIVGAGVVGVSTAVFLQKEGLSVTLVDRVPPGDGCSFGNAGGVCPSSLLPDFHSGVISKLPGWLLDPMGPLTIRWRHFPKALPWMLRAARNAVPSVAQSIIAGKAQLAMRVMSDYETIMAATGTRNLLNLEDAIRLYDSAQQYESEADDRRIRAEHGVVQQKLSIGEVRDLEPDVAEHFHCGLTYGGWYYLTNPKTFVSGMAEQVVRNGGTILHDDVLRAEHDGQRATRLVLKDAGELPLDRLVIAAGAYSDILARQLGSRVLLEAERGYHLTIPEPGVKLGRTITWATRHGAITPMDVGLRLAGTDEFAGCDAPANWKRADILWSAFKRILPGMRPVDDTVSRWMGRRPGTPDSLPVIGPSPKLYNVWYGFGHGHLGMTWGPTTGRLLSELIAGKPSNTDLGAYRIDRF